MTTAVPTAPSKSAKLVPLEGLRGIAAAVVVLYHLDLGFTEKGVGKVPHGHGGWDLLAQFGLGMLNGGAAVAVFFVLSGFILSLPFARDRRVSRVLVAMLKRWPRLAALTTLGLPVRLGQHRAQPGLLQTGGAGNRRRLDGDAWQRAAGGPSHHRAEGGEGGVV